jgi:hypothetical protein
MVTEHRVACFEARSGNLRSADRLFRSKAPEPSLQAPSSHRHWAISGGSSPCSRP